MDLLDKKEVNYVRALIDALVKRGVSKYEDGDFKIEFHKPEQPVEHKFDPDDRRADGHRLMAPTKQEIKQERLKQW